MILHTARLILRPLRRRDLDDLAALYADPEVMRFSGDGKPRTRARVRKRLARALRHWKEHGFGIFALIAKEDGAFVGRCGVADLHGHGAPELAYTLARRFWGQGLATEAAAAVVRHAFEDLHIPRLIGVVRVGNEASRRVLEKVGMRFVRDYEYDGHRALWYESENPEAALTEGG